MEFHLEVNKEEERVKFNFTCNVRQLYTVKPLNKGHIGDGPFVPSL